MKLKKIEPTNYWMNDIFPSNFNTLVNSFFNEDVEENRGFNAFRPSADIKESNEAFQLKLAVPGVTKEDIKIELNNGILEINGERKSVVEENTDKYHLKEIRTGKFNRRFQLPDNINMNEIEANVENGILHINIPKTEEVKPKLISVK